MPERAAHRGEAGQVRHVRPPLQPAPDEERGDRHGDEGERRVDAERPVEPRHERLADEVHELGADSGILALDLLSGGGAGEDPVGGIALRVGERAPPITESSFRSDSAVKIVVVTPEPDGAAGDLEHVRDAAGEAGTPLVERSDPGSRRRCVEEPEADAHHDHPRNQRDVAGVLAQPGREASAPTAIARAPAVTITFAPIRL